MSVKEFLERVFKEFMEGKPKGRMLTLLTLLRLRSGHRGASVDAISREGRRIIRATKGSIDWGVDEESYTEEAVQAILEELARHGLIEEVEPGRYKIREDNDLVDEVYRKVGVIFSLRCC